VSSPSDSFLFPFVLAFSFSGYLLIFLVSLWSPHKNSFQCRNYSFFGHNPMMLFVDIPIILVRFLIYLFGGPQRWNNKWQNLHFKFNFSNKIFSHSNQWSILLCLESYDLLSYIWFFFFFLFFCIEVLNHLSWWYSRWLVYSSVVCLNEPSYLGDRHWFIFPHPIT
jgi:hypothetical protein